MHARVRALQSNRYTSLNCFIEILKKLLKRFTLRSTTGNRRNFRLVATFFRFVNYNFYLHM